ncbi:MAG: carboxylating nicotinate-nucleotide diphosphorylase [Deltaproteobacteria bacterium]|nr:carboxylating nicotinate-nucleotide diphosphorylase [Deltaproteobacteria bacterium]
MLTPHVERLIDAALEEDLGRGDPTSELIFEPEARLRGRLLAKEPLVVCGGAVFERVMRRVDPEVQVRLASRDGDEVGAGAILGEVEGRARSILAAERTALNFLQRLAGVATLARAYVRAASVGRAVIADTRKTTPGWRALEKHAVRVGGARNHRADLSAGILIKDNHIATAGSLGEAVRRVRLGAPHTLRIEVEVQTQGELDEAIAARADVVLLDNMGDEAIGLAVERAAGRVLLEVSGGVGLERVPVLSRLGVDVISVGRLTHSARAVDISLEAERLGR